MLHPSGRDGLLRGLLKEMGSLVRLQWGYDLTKEQPEAKVGVRTREVDAIGSASPGVLPLIFVARQAYLYVVERRTERTRASPQCLQRHVSPRGLRKRG